MAITVEQGNNGRKGLFGLVAGVVVVIALVVATYVLFFVEPPQIEVFAPPEVQTISKISEVDINPSAIINSKEYKALQDHVLPPELGEFGRTNPFARF